MSFPVWSKFCVIYIYMHIMLSSLWVSCKSVKKRPCKLFVLRVKVSVKFTLEQTTKSQRWSRGVALLFL